jgi:hypothetical protein
MEERTRSGGCICGSVRYTVRGEPFHVGRCHCGDCRKRSGSTYTIYGQWPREAFTVEGEYATYQLGSLDDAPFELRPEAEIWIKRREPWLHEVEGAGQYRENRPH